MVEGMSLRARCFALLACLLALPALGAIAPVERSRGDGSQLRAKYEQVRARLERSPYGRPLALDSREMSKALEGDAYAIVSQPFAKVDAALASAGNWCDLLMLPFNTKHCTASRDGSRLALFVGRKNDTPLEMAYKLDFNYRVAGRAPDYLQVVLTAESGPLGTRDYRIVVELAPIDANRTFMHLSYAYAYGMLSKVAMQAYLSTIGAKKVGFTLDGSELVRGMRGIMERNTMRYYLAVDAYLASLEAPAAVRVAKRLNDWFSGQERYPRQLGEEVSRADYLAMKQKEYARVASARVSGGG
jgi:hypothetical protein